MPTPNPPVLKRPLSMQPPAPPQKFGNAYIPPNYTSPDLVDRRETVTKKDTPTDIYLSTTMPAGTNSGFTQIRRK